MRPYDYGYHVTYGDELVKSIKMGLFTTSSIVVQLEYSTTRSLRSLKSTKDTKNRYQFNSLRALRVLHGKY